MRNRILWGSGAGIAALMIGGGALAQTPPPDEPPAQDAGEPVIEQPPLPTTISDAIGAGKLILEVRARYENVDQFGLAHNGEGATVRTRMGWETGDWRGFRALVEFEDVRKLGPIHYNIAVPGPGGASLNGNTTYPIINDPEITEVNRLQVAWNRYPSVGAVVGRQRVLLDDQRFIGSVGWRQDEQTFDGVRLDFATGPVKATYVYVDRVNRILGEAKDWESDSHLFNATWSISEAIKLQGFYYGLEFPTAAANSSATVGARASGKIWAGLVQIAYNATYAQEHDNGSNPASFDLDYIEADLAATYDIWTIRGAYESLQGDGTRGFFTPLGTTHLFNGWADAFATAGGNKTHVDGIEDLNIQLTVQPRWRFTYWSNTQFILRYHDFNAERTGADLASEWDAQMQVAITPKLTFLVKYADYDREETVPLGTTLAPPDRRKAWFSLEYRY